MKKIAALIAASMCTLAFAPSVSGMEQRWGWSDLTAQSWKEAWADIGKPKLSQLQALAGPVVDADLNPVIAPKVEVVAVPVDPKLANAPGVLSAVLPDFEKALHSLRGAVAHDPAVAGRLEAQGYAIDDIVGLTRLKDGTVTVFVGKAG
jgi:hypothetical protein